MGSLLEDEDGYLEYENFKYPAPTIGKWTKIRVTQELEDGDLKYRTSVDDTEIFFTERSVAETFGNVKVFAADPWHPAQPGSIKNLSINVKE